MRGTKSETIGFLYASRIPNLLIIGLTQFIAAYALLNHPIEELFTRNFLLFILSTGMIGAAGYIINDYFDQKVDMINRPATVIVGTNFRRRFALFSHVVLTITGIFIGFIVDPFVGAIHIFSAGALWTYSSVLKRWILLDTLTIAFLTSLTLLLLIVYWREYNLVLLAYAMFGCVITFIRESLKDIISAKGESHFGMQSVPIVWGIRGAKVVIYLAGLAGAGLVAFYLISIQNWNVRYFFFIILVLIIWITYKLAIADRTKDFEAIKKYIDVIILAGLVSMLLV